MRSPLAVNRPHTTVTVNWRKGRGRAAKNAIRRMHEWLSSTLVIDALTEKRRLILQNGGHYELQTTSHEVTEEEKACRAAELKRQKQERNAKEQARKEAQRKAAEEKARIKEEESKKRKAAEEEEHRKWQEEVRRKEEEEKKQKAEEERLKKEKKEAAAAQAAQEEKAKKEKSKKDKQSKSKKMSESEKAVPVEELAVVVQQQHQEATALIPSESTVVKSQQNAKSESAAVVQDEATAPEESKSSKKNKKNKKHSENEHVAEVQKETVVESAPPSAEVSSVNDASTYIINEQQEKKSKKNKKDKKHSESERIVEAQIEAAIEALPVPAADVPESIPAEPIAASIEEAPTPTSTPAEPAEPVVDKSDKKSKKNKKHSESEQSVEQKMETVIESLPTLVEDAPPTHAQEHNEKKSKKNKKDKKHSESEAAERKETVVESVPPVVEETPVASAEASHEYHDKESKKHKKDKKHSESESTAKVEQKPSADVEEPCIAIVLPPSHEENVETAVEATPDESIAHGEKTDKKKKNRNKKNSESKANGHVSNGVPVSHAQEIVKEPSATSEDKENQSQIKGTSQHIESESEPSSSTEHNDIECQEYVQIDTKSHDVESEGVLESGETQPIEEKAVIVVHETQIESEIDNPCLFEGNEESVSNETEREIASQSEVVPLAFAELCNEHENENEPSTSGVIVSEEKTENITETPGVSKQMQCQEGVKSSGDVSGGQKEVVYTYENVISANDSVIIATSEQDITEEKNADSISALAKNRELTSSISDQQIEAVNEASLEETHNGTQTSIDEAILEAKVPLTVADTEGSYLKAHLTEQSTEQLKNQEQQQDVVHGAFSLSSNEEFFNETVTHTTSEETSTEASRPPAHDTGNSASLENITEDNDFEKIQMEDVEADNEECSVDQHASSLDSTVIEENANKEHIDESISQGFSVPITVEALLPTVEIPVNHTSAEEVSKTTEDTVSAHFIESSEVISPSEKLEACNESLAVTVLEESTTIPITVEPPCTEVVQIEVKHILNEVNVTEKIEAHTEVQATDQNPVKGNEECAQLSEKPESFPKVKEISSEDAVDRQESVEQINNTASFKFPLGTTEISVKPVIEAESQKEVPEANDEQLTEIPVTFKNQPIEEVHSMKEAHGATSQINTGNQEAIVIPMTVDALNTTVVEIPVTFSNNESEAQQAEQSSDQINQSPIADVSIPLLHDIRKSGTQQTQENEVIVKQIQANEELQADHQRVNAIESAEHMTDALNLPVDEQQDVSVAIPMTVEAPFTQVVEIAVQHITVDQTEKETTEEKAIESVDEATIASHDTEYQDLQCEGSLSEKTNVEGPNHGEVCIKAENQPEETLCEQNAVDTSAEENHEQKDSSAEISSVKVPMTVDAPCNQVVEIKAKNLQDDAHPSEASIELHNVPMMEVLSFDNKEEIKSNECDALIRKIPERVKEVSHQNETSSYSETSITSADETIESDQVEPQTETKQEEIHNENPEIDQPESTETKKEFIKVPMTVEIPFTGVIEIAVQHIESVNSNDAERSVEAPQKEITNIHQKTQIEAIVEQLENLQNRELIEVASKIHVASLESVNENPEQNETISEQQQSEVQSFEHFDSFEHEKLEICKSKRSVEFIMASEIPLTDPVDNEHFKVTSTEQNVEGPAEVTQEVPSANIYETTEKVPCDPTTDTTKGSDFELKVEQEDGTDIAVQQTVMKCPVEWTTERPETSLIFKTEHGIGNPEPTIPSEHGEAIVQHKTPEETLNEIPTNKSQANAKISEISAVENQAKQKLIEEVATETFADAVESLNNSIETPLLISESIVCVKEEGHVLSEIAADETVQESFTEVKNENGNEINESQIMSEVTSGDCEEKPVECIHSTPENVEPIVDTNACEGEKISYENEVSETNKGVELETRSENRSEFVISEHGSETVVQEHDTIVTVVVTEAPASTAIPESIADVSVVAPNAHNSSTHNELNEQNSVEESFIKVHESVNAAQKDEIIQKEEADTTHGKSGKNKKKNKKNRNSKSITESHQTEIMDIAELDKHADAEVAALNPGSASPPIQVNEITSTEHMENGNKETIETIISQHIVDQKDVSPTRFAQNVQALVEKTLKHSHTGAEIDPNVKMQIDVQLQKLAERRPVVEARNVITPLPLQLHISRPTTPVNRERLYKLLPKDIIFCSGLIDAHGENFNAMATDSRNIYRESARGLQRKIRIFKESPHYQTYLKAKEEGITVEALLAAEAAH